MRAFSTVVIVALYVAAIAAIVVGAFRFFTRTQLGRRLGGLERPLGIDGSTEVLEELRQLRAELADIQERLDVTEGIVARLSHVQPRPLGQGTQVDKTARP